jgi:hypothetical protein
MTGSTPWLVVGVLVTGVRVLRRLAASEGEVLYRTAIRTGDAFEIVTRTRK